MKKYLASFLALSLVAVISLGCGESTVPAPTVTEAVYEAASLCGDCGQLKGTAVCCAEGAETCKKCSLTAGAPGCCKMEKGIEVALCTKCGQIEKTEACCAEGAETCEHCNLAKGAPGCCKLQLVSATGLDTDDHSAAGHYEADHDHDDEGEGHDEDGDDHAENHDTHADEHEADSAT